jgi:diacylglycerol kinase (ATP)
MSEVARSGGFGVDQRPLPESRHRRPAPTGRPNVLLLANGNASGLIGHLEAIEHAAYLLRSWGARVEAKRTASADELEHLVSEEERRIVLLGGDGTLHAVANVCGHKPEVALLPLGRANNMARALGVPLDLDAAAGLAVEGRPLGVDGISVRAPGRSMIALEGVSAGFHAQARARYRGVNSADTAAGVAAALRAFARFQPVSVALEVDGDLELRRLGQLFVVNFPLFGPRLPVAPTADPSDGILELVELDSGGRISLARQFARLRRGTHLGRDSVRVRRTRRVRIATDGPVVADTTILGGPVELAVQPRTIRVVTPGL